MGVQLTQEMINGAILTQEKYGVPASVTLGQIILESGGNYPGGLSGLAYNDNNLFGIKTGSGWEGQSVTYKTTEYVDGQKVTVNASFRKYNSVLDSIEDHGELLSSSIYTNKTNGATGLTDYVQKMGSIYATSPTYANDLLNIINKNNLTQYDNGSLPDKIVQTSPKTDPLAKYKNNPWINITGSSSTTQKETSEATGGYRNPFGAYIEISGEIKQTGDPWGVFGGKYEEVVEETKDKLFGWWDDLWTSVTFTIVIVLLVVLAVVFLLKSFNMMPTKQNLISKIIPVSVPEKTEAKENE